MSVEQSNKSAEYVPFANASWGKHMHLLEDIAGYQYFHQFDRVAERLTGHPMAAGDTFSSKLLSQEFSQFLAPELGSHKVEFGIWNFRDEVGNTSIRRGFRTAVGDTLRMAYCEYKGGQAASVGLMASWVDPETEESVYRDVSILRDNSILDKRSAVHKNGIIEYPYASFGSKHMHIEQVPLFRQLDAVYDHHPDNGMELAYARQALFDVNGNTTGAYEYELDLNNRSSQFFCLVGYKDMSTFVHEVTEFFAPDESLEGANISHWSS